MKLIRRGFCDRVAGVVTIVILWIILTFYFKSGLESEDDILRGLRKDFQQENENERAKESWIDVENDIQNNINGGLEINDDVQSEKFIFPDSKVIEGFEYPKRNWENLEEKKRDAARTGLGEQGVKAHLPPELEKEKKTLWDINGFNGLLSEQIALDRALRDLRHAKCSSLHYSESLPTASVVIPFYEEHLWTLQRTVTSIINRSPEHLLKEVILVNDGSLSNVALRKPLEEWLKNNVPDDKFRLVVHEERKGLIAARMAGAEIARGDVIVVLDSHCECMVNWLVPLLDPIQKNRRTVVSPLIDCIEGEDFQYFPQDDGGRGGFDWKFNYKRMPLLKYQLENMPQPYKNPVMNGGLFAISKDFYNEIGGYDPGIKIWGGEQYELSFKLWQCGGELYDAPCSRVGHIFRGPAPKRPHGGKVGNFIDTNYKRVGEVWMSPFNEALYEKLPHLRKTDTGDISKQLKIKEDLQCKSFDWFLKEVAPDLTEYYPPFEPKDFANGTIKSLHDRKICLDYGGRNYGPILPYGCHGLGTQYFAYCWRNFIRISNEQFCFHTYGETGKPLTMTNCVNIGPPPSMLWDYNPGTKLIKNVGHNTCVELSEDKQRITLEACNLLNDRQHWIFQHLNKDRIKDKREKIT